jgi:Protein of unknown function (DUF3761)
MKYHLYVAAFVLGILISPTGTAAQAPAGAPAGSTGQCNDGTYTNAPSKKGACRGHQGVKSWFAASSSAPAPATPASSPAPAAVPAPAAPAAAPASNTAKTTKTTTASSAPAAGGGPGLVWLNTSSNVYHCYGTKYYGTTKTGKYVTEAQAKAAGAHADHDKPCGK